MSKYLVSKCCFCVNLRLGSILLGYLQMIVNVIVTIALLNVIKNTRQKISIKEPKAIKQEILLAIAIAHVVLNVDCFFFASALLIGLHKDKLENVKSYILFASFFFVLSVALIVIDLITWFSFWVFALGWLDILFTGYVLYVVYSYYTERKEEQ